MQLPQLPSQVLRLSLHATATTTSNWLEILSEAVINVDCQNCTLLVPTNGAIQAANLSKYSSDELKAIARSHVIHNRIAYTTTIAKGELVVTLAGNVLAYGTNKTGSFVVGNETTALMLRTNIPARSSVIHVSAVRDTD